MLRIFRIDHPFILLVVLFYTGLLNLKGYLFPVPVSSESSGILGAIFTEWVGSGKAAFWAHFVVVFVQAVLLNYIVNFFRLSKAQSYYIAIFYILVLSAIYPTTILSAPLMGLTFLIVSLHQLFKVFKAKETAGLVFNVGFWIAVASLFYLPWIFFFIYGIIGLIMLNTMSPRNLLILFIGFFVPYFLLWTYFFFIGQGWTIWQIHILENLSFFDIGALNIRVFYYRLILMALVLFLAFLNWNKFLFRTKIQVQKYFSLLLVMLVFGLISFFFQKAVGTEHLIIICVPLSVFLGLSFLNMKNKPFSELIHLFLLLCLFAYQYQEQLLDLIVKTAD